MFSVDPKGWRFLGFIFFCFIWVSCSKEDHFDGDKEAISYLLGLPRRNLLHDPLHEEFLKNHGIYISVTTTPKRLNRLSQVFKTIDLTMVTKVYLALPKDRTYELVPEEIQELIDLSKIEILKPERDLGPITKLIPALEELRLKDSGAILITIDDDVGYSPNLVTELADVSLRYQAVVGGHGLKAEFFGLTRGQNWPFQEKNEVDILEGVSGVAYQPKFFSDDNIRKMKRWVQESPDCEGSDDFVISYVLEQSGVKKSTVKNSFIPRHIPFSYGFLSDARHKGEGGSYLNPEKYQACGNYIMSHEKE